MFNLKEIFIIHKYFQNFSKIFKKSFNFNIYRCARSCDQSASEALLCVPDDCQPGCVCKTPFVQLSQNDKDNCILPEQCPLSWFNNNNNKPTTTEIVHLFGDEGVREQQFTNNHFDSLNTLKCSNNANKEWRNCASSCPLGCDNLELKLCTPCVSGCFCKNGLF